jgi:hypothetical protein
MTNPAVVAEHARQTVSGVGVGSAVGAVAIELDSVTNVFGAGTSAMRALDGVSVSFPPHRFTAVMGPSGRARRRCRSARQGSSVRPRAAFGLARRISVGSRRRNWPYCADALRCSRSLGPRGVPEPSAERSSLLAEIDSPHGAVGSLPPRMRNFVRELRTERALAGAARPGEGRLAPDDQLDRAGALHAIAAASVNAGAILRDQR